MLKKRNVEFSNFLNTDNNILENNLKKKYY